MKQFIVSGYRLLLAPLLALTAFHSSGSLAQSSFEPKAAPAATGTTQAPSRLPTNRVNTSPKMPTGNPTVTRPTSAVPLDLDQCRKLGGTLEADTDGLCTKTGLRCVRYDPKGVKQVCISDLVEPD